MYNHKEIEKKWQSYWEENKTFKTKETGNEKKFILDMFPYPSGAGLHVGHPLSYTATDVVSRMYRMQGFDVLHPMGWDAFGLPAEQYAIKTGNDPREFTNKNINNFRNQLKSLGFSYDWDKEVNTSSEKYYRNTQWIFAQLYKKGLAEVKEIEVNWCEGLGTVLANEEIIVRDGKMFSDIGDYPVVKKPMKQWVLKITHYAERLLEDLDSLDWPVSTKEMQRNWIGKSVGAIVTFNVSNSNEKFDIFTTRPDTLFGATYCVLSPEHPLLKTIVTNEQKEDVTKYQEFAKTKTDLERTELNKDKTGVFTGAYAENPINGKLIPIWISDYVLSTYGTGAIMAVPAHDSRDYAFAKKFNLEIIQVLEGGNVQEEAFEGDGFHINSDFLDGLDKSTAIDKVIDFLEEKKIGRKNVNYKLRDWIFSRQRFWGEPFPVIFWEDGEIEILEASDLPLPLPVTDYIKPSGTGESPLANVSDWVNVVRKDGVKGRRETNTMPQWAGSCWYYLAYILSDNGNYLDIESEEAKEKIYKWLPVDLYIGGAEHSVLHLLYARFWHKVLYDIGVVNTKEPFQKLFHQGMILSEDGQKMSKSKGNVVNPDEIVDSYGSDSFRLYEMFMGPLEGEKPWSANGVEGARKFIERVYRMVDEVVVIDESSTLLDKAFNQTVKKVSSDYENLSFNTAIAQMMVFVNEVYKVKNISTEQLKGFIKLLNPIAPHVTEELYSRFSNESISYSKWPICDESKLVESKFTVVIQVNGKLRDKIEVDANQDEEVVKKQALENEKVQNAIFEKNVEKIIYIKNKLVNIVIK